MQYPLMLEQNTHAVVYKDASGRTAFRHVAAMLTVIASVAFSPGVQAQVTGAGSTLVRELVAGWASQFGAASGGVTYEAQGSSAGVSRAIEQSTDFGVSDVPQTAAALRLAGLRQVPLAGAAVAVIVNLPELAGKTIKLNGDILAEIYQGNIKQWNHAQIAGANPGVALPNRAIVPVWRSDGSGQSYAFTTYLSRGNSKWRRTVGATSNLAPNVGRSAKGGQALLDVVKTTPGAIGYDSLGAAQKAGLNIAELLNSSGKSIAPNAASIGEALERAQWLKDSNSADLDGSAGLGSYPMTVVPYALIPVATKKGRISALPFVQSAVALGDAQVKQGGFVPLPPVAKAIALAVAAR
jgi:phosphate transport system substrate-binding protein